MISQHTSKKGLKSFTVRVGNGPSKTFNEADYRTRSEAKAAAKIHEANLILGKRPDRLPTLETYATRVLDHWANEVMPKSGRKRKTSTMVVQRQSMKAVRDKFGAKRLDQVTREMARNWALTVPTNCVKVATQLFNRAIDEYPEITRNPFRGLAPQTKGRSEEAPPTEREFNRLLDAWEVHGDYAVYGRAMQTFAGHSGMRPGELYALEWSDIDFDAGRINVMRRLYQGETDLPKSNKTRRIVLTSEARDALLSVPHVSKYVFPNKSGGRLSQAAMSIYWGKVKAGAKLDLDFYLCTRHRFVHDAFVNKRLSVNAIAQQLGWSHAATEALLKVYGHGDTGWQEEWESNVVELRAAK